MAIGAPVWGVSYLLIRGGHWLSRSDPKGSEDETHSCVAQYVLGVCVRFCV